MMWLSKPELVSAVANAGALACLPAAMFPTADELAEAIKQTRGMTDKPFGVNVSLFPALVPRPPEEMIQTIIDNDVKIIETAGRSPANYIGMIQGAGLTHIHKCARVRDAVKVDGLGVNIISIVGTECGGHPSMEGVTSMVLIPQAVDAVKAPLIAGGGFGDGRAMVIALAMGAEAVNMGTRFMATKECPMDQKAKDRLVQAVETDTIMVMQTLGNPSRTLRTPWTEKIVEMENQGASLEDLIPFISGKSGVTGWQAGNVDEGIFPCGQVVGRLHDVPTVAELVERIVKEAQETKTKLDSWF